MFVITVDFEIKSEFVNEFRNRVLQQAKDSLNNEEKCFTFDVCFDEKNTKYVRRISEGCQDDVYRM